MFWNQTLLLCFSLCMYIFYDRARKQFLQFWNLNLLIYSIPNSISIDIFHLQ